VIRNYSKKLDKSTLEKARLYNNQFSNSVPFWITFFEEIESKIKQEGASLVSKVGAVIGFEIACANNQTISYAIELERIV
jgi:hypothetical protein